MKQVEAYRKMLKLTQKQMAEIAGCKVTSYNRKENGFTAWNSDEMQNILIEIRKTYPNVTCDIFFDDAVHI